MTVNLAEDIDGVIKASELSVDKVEDAKNVVKVDEEIEAKIVSVDRKNRTISLSVKALTLDDEKEAVQAQKDKQPENAPTTIGDLIKAQMDK